MSQMRIYKFAVTGGPCGGKTTVMAALREKFESLGFEVRIAPEAATILFANGFQPRGVSKHDTALLQAELMRVQISIEDTMITSLKRASLKGVTRPGVMLCDRGLLDNKAYMTTEEWDLVMWTVRLNELAMRNRYDGVLHLQSAAVGARRFYKNTEVRLETVEEAAELEQRTLDAWRGQALHTLVGNKSYGGMAGKVFRAKEAALYMLRQLNGGSPTP